VLKQGGPRKVSVFRGLAASQLEYEAAIGRLFLEGSVRWIGAKRSRLLAAKTRKAT
jgi:hypothetical protein